MGPVGSHHMFPVAVFLKLSPTKSITNQPLLPASWVMAICSIDYASAIDSRLQLVMSYLRTGSLTDAETLSGTKTLNVHDLDRLIGSKGH